MPINASDLLALLPLLVLAGSAVVVMLAVALRRRHGLTVGLTLAGLILSFATLPVAAGYVPRTVTPLLIMDRYTLFFTGLMLASTAAVTALCYGYFHGRRGVHEELYVLLLTATLGAVVLVASRHFAALFLGLEILSVSLFALVPYSLESSDRRPIEAGTKYLVLAGVSSAFLLFGMALIYTRLGTLAFPNLAHLPQAGSYLNNVYVLAGVMLIVAGLGFKLSLVPFHMWTPDVYQGAPAPVTAFLATVSKGAVFVLLLRYFVEAGLYNYYPVVLAVTVVAIASMLVGNLLALLQNNVKRILAYSSIAHMGYLLVALLASGALAVEAVSYYLVAYIVMTLGAFGVVGAMTAPDQTSETGELEHYFGLFWRRPWLAGTFSAMLLSLAGIPLTVGFIGKFYIFTAGVDAALWLLVFVLVAGSVIGLYYYLRVVVAMFVSRPDDAAMALGLRHSLSDNLVLTVLTIFLLWFGLYPSPLVQLIQATALQLE